MAVTELERFAFNQARFVFYTAYTVERDMISGMSLKQSVERIRRSFLMGKKYLLGVALEEIEQEMKEPGSFMDANTNLGKWCNDEYGNYVEDFKEK